MKLTLRLLFVLVAISSIAVAIFSYRYHEQKKILDWLRAHEIQVAYDNPDSTDWILNNVDPDLVGTVTHLRIDRFGLTDLSPLAKLTSLKHLELCDPEFSNIEPVTQLKNLEFLHLNRTQVQDLAGLESLTKLTTLNATHTMVSDLGPLTSLTNLETLCLNNTEINDILPLSAMINLREIQISDTKVSDLTPLYSLTNLKTLCIGNLPISKSELSELRKRLPNCRILWW